MILYDNRRRSPHWLDKNKAPKHMPKTVSHRRRAMVAVWWTRAVHCSFFPPGQAISFEIYCAELDAIYHILSKFRALAPFEIYLTIMPVPSLLHTLRKLPEWGHATLPHSPYSHLSQTDYHLLSRLAHAVWKAFQKPRVDGKPFKQFIKSKMPNFLIESTVSNRVRKNAMTLMALILPTTTQWSNKFQTKSERVNFKIFLK